VDVTLSTIINLAIAILLGGYLIQSARRERAAAPPNPTPRVKRTHLIKNLGLISGTVGILAVFAWMTTDNLGPRWIHTIALPTSVALIAGGFVLAFVAAARDIGTGSR
jgi:archaellum biogenesis protein FlaJ (TadC family)